MKSKEIFLFIFCCYLSLSINGQDLNNPKHQFLFDIGGNYNYFYGNRFIDSIANYGTSNSHIEDYAGYTIVPASGIHFGFQYDYALKNKLIFELELLYNNRRCIYKSESVKLLKYKNWHNPEYEDVIKYNVSSNNIEAELDIGYYYKKFTFFAGAKIFLASFEKRKLTDISGIQKKQNGFYYNIFNDLSYIELYPELKLCYSLPFKNYNAQIYLGIDKSMGISMEAENENSIFFVYGIKLPFFKNLKS